MRAAAYAKVNLALRVGGRRPDGFHELSSLAQSIDLSDRVELLDDGERVEVNDPAVPTDHRNLAVAAIAAVRALTDGPAVGVRLTKRIPTRAGLGGGSADAAAALGLAAHRYGVPMDEVAALAPDLGSDVPFCLVGGTAVVSGRGETVDPLRPAGGYALGVVTPPIELATADVFRAFDGLESDPGVTIGGSALPPSLRDYGPLGNELHRAAMALAPDLEEWRLELESLWERPVAMSGSGTSLFAYFADRDEAESACAVVPTGVRLATAALPVERGWARER